MWYTLQKGDDAMYISMKALRIIYAAAFIGIIYFNFSLSHNDKVPDYINRKIGTISLIALIVMTIVGTWFGIISPSE